jgi:probable rRNA maturation factor
LSGTLLIQNRQKAVRVDTRHLRVITTTLLKEILELKTFNLAIHLVGAAEMARINKTYLNHEGSTDVITFDYAEASPPDPRPSTLSVHGEIFISTDDALTQARQFRTTWQSELARYIIHGILHLRGYDDLKPAPRRKMKREENRLLREVARRFPLSKLGSALKLRP